MEKQLEIMNQNLERIAIALESVQEELKTAREERAAPDYVILHGKRLPAER